MGSPTLVKGLAFLSPR